MTAFSWCLFLGITCGAPPNGINTVPVPAEVSLVYEEKYVYSCLPGYKLADENMTTVTTCKADGIFSLDILPNCTDSSKKYLFYI